MRPALRVGRTSLLVVTGLTALAGPLALTSHPETLSAVAAEPTFAEDVAPILYKNCTSCHHPGGIGPFSLIEYDSARANATDIREMVSTGQMPPWHASGAHGVFRNDRRLSDADKQTILRWIQAGMPRGDMKKLPAPPVYTSAWEAGTPDLVVTMPTDYVVPASGTIEYQYFEKPVEITEDKWIRSIEIMPGDRAVVHHVLVYARVPTAADTATVAPPPVQQSGAAPAPPPALQRDPQFATPSVPRGDPNNPPPRRLGALIGTTAPGTNVLEFGPGTAMRLRKGTILTFQMHYTAHGHETKDRTSVGFRFTDTAPAEEIFATAFFNGKLEIPAGAKDVAIPASVNITTPVKIWGLFPHTHVRGTRWEYAVQKPDGSSDRILDVPRYDFNWQTYYLFSTPLEIPAGSKIVSTAWYDNSAGNKNNPDATKTVRWGDQTWEEMQYTGVLYSIVGRKP